MDQAGDEKAQAGNYDGAISDYTQAILLQSNCPEAYCGRGNAYYRLNNKIRALEDYTHAITLKPEFSEAYFNRGTARSQLGNSQGRLKISVEWCT